MKLPANSREEAAKLPWDYPGNVFAPGRYYYGMVYVSWPPFILAPQGSDFMAQLWRMNDSPSEWIITARSRRYTTRSNAWDGQDTKKWMLGKFQGTEPEAAEHVRKMAADMASAFPGARGPEWVLMQGDADKAMDAMLNCGRDWLHVRTLKADEAGKIKGVETHIRGESPNQ